MIVGVILCYSLFTYSADDIVIIMVPVFQSAITHPNRDLKSSVTFSWIAPSSGSGQLLILLVANYYSN